MLKKCCRGCSVRTSKLIVLWIDATLKAILATLCLLIGYGLERGMKMFESVDHKLPATGPIVRFFFDFKMKILGAKIKVDDFELLKLDVRQIFSTTKPYASLLFYFNTSLLSIAVLGIVAVHLRKQLPLLIYGVFRVIEIMGTAVVLYLAYQEEIHVPFFLIAFPGAIDIAVKSYGIGLTIVYSRWIRRTRSVRSGNICAC